MPATSWVVCGCSGNAKLFSACLMLFRVASVMSYSRWYPLTVGKRVNVTQAVMFALRVSDLAVLRAVKGILSDIHYLFGTMYASVARR
jgi:hypothetical protein